MNGVSCAVAKSHPTVAKSASVKLAKKGSKSASVPLTKKGHRDDFILENTEYTPENSDGDLLVVDEDVAETDVDEDVEESEAEEQVEDDGLMSDADEAETPDADESNESRKDKPVHFEASS